MACSGIGRSQVPRGQRVGEPQETCIRRVGHPARVGAREGGERKGWNKGGVCAWSEWWGLHPGNANL